MSKPVKFNVQCRGCDREFSRLIEIAENQAVDGKRIRCKECNTTNYTEQTEPVV